MSNSNPTPFVELWQARSKPTTKVTVITDQATIRTGESIRTPAVIYSRNGRVDVRSKAEFLRLFEPATQ